MINKINAVNEINDTKLSDLSKSILINLFILVCVISVPILGAAVFLVVIEDLIRDIYWHSYTINNTKIAFLQGAIVVILNIVVSIWVWPLLTCN